MNVVGGAKGRYDGRRIRRAFHGLVYQRVGVLDVAREPRDKSEAQAVFNADESSVMDVPGCKKSLDKLMGLPELSTKLSHFQMRIPELLF